MIDLSLSKQIEPYNLLLQHYILLWYVFFFTQQFEITKNV